jgi:hypothetical protein
MRCDSLCYVGEPRSLSDALIGSQDVRPPGVGSAKRCPSNPQPPSGETMSMMGRIGRLALRASLGGIYRTANEPVETR